MLFVVSFHRIACLLTLMCVRLHPFYLEAEVLALEKICSKWVFVGDQKFPTGFLSDPEVKNKTKATEWEVKDRLSSSGAP